MAIVSFCALMILGTVANTVVAQGRTVGVLTGNTFEYNISFGWNSSDSNGTIPDPYKTISETDRMSVLITDISGMRVTAQITTHFENDSETTQFSATDVDTGAGNMTYWLVASNLSVNETVFTSGTYSRWRIDETIVRSYQDVTRNTNHLNMTVEGNIDSDYEYVSTNVYWDQATGIMVEMQATVVFRLNGIQSNMTTSIVMSQSNVWVIPEFSMLASTLILVIVTAFAFLSQRSKLGKTETH